MSNIGRSVSQTYSISKNEEYNHISASFVKLNIYKPMIPANFEVYQSDSSVLSGPF